MLPAASDAVRVLGVNIQGVENRRPRMDMRTTRSRREMARGRRSATWGLNAYFGIASAGTGNAPPLSALLKNHFGNETVTANTSVVYALSKNDGGSFDLWSPKPNMHSHAYGCISESLTIAATLDDFVTFAFTGTGKDMGRTAATTIPVAGSSATSLTPENIDALTVGSLIMIDGDGLHVVTGKTSTGVVTIEAAGNMGCRRGHIACTFCACFSCRYRL